MLKKIDLKISIANLFLLILPISFVLGNLFINLNTLLIIIFTFFYFWRKILKITFSSVDKSIFIFFGYTLFVLIINYLNQDHFDNSIIIKTIFFFRYLLLYIALRVLIEEKIFNQKLFVTSCSIIILFIIIDIFFQFINGSNLFGMKSVSPNHNSSVFGKELIAGGFIQRFCLFVLFLPYIIKQKKINKFFINLSLIIIFFLGILLSGNRMPLILYTLSILLLYFFIGSKKNLFTILASIIIIFTLAFLKNDLVKNNTNVFIKNVKDLILVFSSNNLTNVDEKIWRKPYVGEFNCAKIIYKQKPLFGGGIRSYRTNTKYCSTHPHNYYLEILTDLGFFGLLIIIVIFFQILIKILKFKLKVDKNYFALVVSILLFVEMFPLRSSGSFFSTNNATLIFFLISMLVSLLNNSQNRKKIK